VGASSLWDSVCPDDLLELSDSACVQPPRSYSWEYDRYQYSSPIQNRESDQKTGAYDTIVEKGLGKLLDQFTLYRGLDETGRQMLNTVRESGPRAQAAIAMVRESMPYYGVTKTVTRKTPMGSFQLPIKSEGKLTKNQMRFLMQMLPELDL